MKMVLPVDGYRSATEFMAAMQGSEGDTHWLMKQDNALPGWMQAARQHGRFNQVVTVSGEDAPAVKAGEIIGHLSLHECPYDGSQHFCHLEVFSQDARMKDFLANRTGVTTGAAELHTPADKARWYHREEVNTFVVAVVGATLHSVRQSGTFSMQDGCINGLDHAEQIIEFAEDFLSNLDSGALN